MKELNGYTALLFLCGLLSAGWTAWSAPGMDWYGILPILLLIIILDAFPIRLISGDYFSAGTVGFFILLLVYGLEACLLGVLVSTITFFAKLYRNPLRFRWVRLFSTVGMYSLSATAAYQLVRIDGFATASSYAKVFASATVFEVTNALLMAGIMKSTAGLPFFHQYKVKLKELAVSVILTVVVVPHLLAHDDAQRMLYDEIASGLFYTAVILLFSRAYVHEAGLRHHASKEFIRLFESRIHPHMEGHGIRVGRLCEMVLERVDFPQRQKKELIQAAVMHDIGKVLLMPHLFQKRGPLTLQEEEEYRSHSAKGAEIARTFYYSVSLSSQWILHHHERYDGKGYPDGLSGERIPLGARIIALCNRIDRLLSEPADDESILRQLAKSAGTELDPRLAKLIDGAFLEEAREAISPYYRTAEAPAEDPLPPEQDRSTHDIGDTFMLRYSTIHRRFAATDRPAPYEALEPLARRSAELRTPFHDLVDTDTSVYDAHFFPEEGEVRIFLVDVTPTLLYKSKLYADAMRAYRDVICTLSQQKVMLCLRQEEIDEHLGERLGSLPIQTKSDIGKSRDFAAGFAECDSKRLMSIKLAVSEAATNLIKHANGGTLTVYAKEGLLQVLIADRGSGIPLHELPKTVLVSGYSTKSSLGKGFSLIYHASDEVSIYTSPRGTRLLLEFRLKESPVPVPMPQPITA